MEAKQLDKIDRFGHCVSCCRNLIVKRVVDGKVIEMFSPEHGHAEFLLSNGSKMQVCMCTKCKATIDLTCPKVQSDIMQAVNKGWELETKALVQDGKWTDEYRTKHLALMKRLDIDCHSEALDDRIVREKSVNLAQDFTVKIITERAKKVEALEEAK